jgi:hypothetical protein
MKWIVIVVGGLVLLITIVAVIGAALPRNHTASRTLRVRQPPQEAWTAITQAMSTSDVPTDIVESDPPRKLVSKVKETEKMFGGTWTVAVAPDDPSTLREPHGHPEQGGGARGSGQAGCTITITEDGWVANPIFRFVSRYVMGHHATMDGMLKRVAKQFGEEPSLSGE